MNNSLLEAAEDLVNKIELIRNDSPDQEDAPNYEKELAVMKEEIKKNKNPIVLC